MRLQDEVRAIVQRDGVIARKQHPELANAMDVLSRDRQLAAVLPGVYSAAGQVDERAVRLAALARWAPDAVLTGASAAQLSFWPTLRGSEVACALRWERREQRGFRFSRRRVPPELVVDRLGFRLTTPSLTALDLCAEHGGDGIDTALRSRTATIDAFWEAFALTGGRRGNADRRAFLLDSRAEPWSAAERLAHRLLRGAGITGWTANHPVRLEDQTYYLDVAFAQRRLAIEIDGRLHEDDPEVFENDRWRQNALVAAGWTVLRFTWRMLEEHPDTFVARVRELLG